MSAKRFYLPRAVRKPPTLLLLYRLNKKRTHGHQKVLQALSVGGEGRGAVGVAFVLSAELHAKLAEARACAA